MFSQFEFEEEKHILHMAWLMKKQRMAIEHFENAARGSREYRDMLLKMSDEELDKEIEKREESAGTMERDCMRKAMECSKAKSGLVTMRKILDHVSGLSDQQLDDEGERIGRRLGV